MGKIESTIKLEILRLAKKELKAAFSPLRREVWAMKLKLSGLAKDFALLNRLARGKMRQDESKKLMLEASPEELKTARLTPERIRNLRKKKGLSQKELSILTGVTVGAVVSWEKGKFKPQGDKKASLVALRKVRKRDVKKMLAEREGGKEKLKLIKRRGKTRSRK